MRPIANGIRIAHTEEIYTFSAATTKIVAKLPILPCSLGWLDAMARGYSRYKFIKCQAFWVPSVGTDHAGMISFAFGYDEMDLGSIPLNDVTVSDISVMANAVTQPVYSVGQVPSLMDCAPGRSSQNWYPYVSLPTLGGVPREDRNDFTQGYLYSVVEQSVGTGSLGRIFLSYEIELIDTVSQRFAGPLTFATAKADRAKLFDVQQADVPVLDNNTLLSNISAALRALHVTVDGIVEVANPAGGSLNVSTIEGNPLHAEVDNTLEVNVVNDLLHPVPAILTAPIFTEQQLAEMSRMHTTQGDDDDEEEEDDEEANTATILE